MTTDSHWRKRARANLEGAGQLLSDANFEIPATSRNYYALFQAIIAVLTNGGRRPSDFKKDATWWRHEIVENNLKALPDLRRCSPDIRMLFKRLRARRETADYGPDFPNHDDVREDHGALRPMLARLGINS
jgi:uncharacterized protein (UPF0332 family)